MRRLYHRRAAKGSSSKHGPDRMASHEAWFPLVSIEDAKTGPVAEAGHRSLGLRIVASVRTT